jgi:2-polyprenyl-3-methyl-5-hydroxy-6-metoxy-1,4-benzoquinol methylase
VTDYRDLIRANWDDRVPAHVASADYDVRRFAEDPEFIFGVVRFDLPLLGDVAGLREVHLQCHIGTDTVSLARLGASMTGLDFSGPAVRAARELAAATGADANRRYQAVRRRDRSVVPGRVTRWVASGAGTPSRSIQWSM